MKRIFSLPLIVAAAMTFIVACNKPDEPGGGPGGDVVNGFDKTAMLRYYADSLIIPGYQELKQDLVAMNVAASGFMATPSPESQQSARAAYTKAYRSYQRIAGFQFGPAESALLDLYLNFSGGLDYNFNTAGELTGFSVDTATIDSVIRGAENTDLTKINRTSFYSQGFGAVGYLLFSQHALAAFQKSGTEARIRYVNTVTDRMAELVEKVVASWTGSYRGEFIANTKTNVGSPIGNLVNQFAYQMDLLKGPRIGWPFGKQSNGIVFPSKTEGFYAGISVSLAVENLKSLKNSYSAGNSGKGIGGYLAALGQEQLNKDVLAQMDAAIAKLEAIPDPLSTSLTANAGAVDQAYKEMQKLLTLLKTDVASATAVQITFMDNDGIRAMAALTRTTFSEMLRRPVSVAPLVSFRIIFGLLMSLSLLRFWWRGWVTAVYVKPVFHFHYTGFDWVRPFGETGMHVLFALLILSAVCIALGLAYRLSAIVFFLGFTYVELLDATTYLNHYYFISLVSFLLIWLPANRQYALDLLLWPKLRRAQVPAWCVGILRFQLALVYCYAGLAKLNPDWLFDAQPLRTWLPAKSHLPIIGPLMGKLWMAYLFSWAGACYDLLIPLFLLRRRSRPIAYVFVLIFHIATAIFFPGIGMFPYVMIACSLIFFSAAAHERVLEKLPGYRSGRFSGWSADPVYRFRFPRLIAAGIVAYVVLQLLVPLRFMLYPGHLFWQEEGYRFSWRVMLMEKSGAAYFSVRDTAANKVVAVNNAEFLTPLQEKMMSTQPDLILKYAHFLAQVYRQRGVQNPAVHAEIWVSLNGQRSRLFVDTTVNLAAEPNGWQHYRWVLPYSAREVNK